MKWMRMDEEWGVDTFLGGFFLVIPFLVLLVLDFSLLDGGQSNIDIVIKVQNTYWHMHEISFYTILYFSGGFFVQKKSF